MVIRRARKHRFSIGNEEIDSVIEEIAGTNSFFRPRFMLLEHQRQWEAAGKPDPFLEFIQDGLGGCYDLEDKFAAQLLKIHLMYRVARMYCPSSLGVSAFCHLVLKGTLKMGKTGLSELLSMGKLFHYAIPAKAVVEGMKQAEQHRILEIFAGNLGIEFREGLKGINAEDLKALFEQTYVRARRRHAKKELVYPITAMFDVTANPETRFQSDDALLRRLIQLAPRGLPQPDSDPPKFNFDVLYKVIPLALGYCTAHLSTFLTREFPEFVEQHPMLFNGQIPSISWKPAESLYREFIHNECDTMPEAELTQWQCSVRNDEDRPEICQIVPAIYLNVLAFTKEHRGLLTRTDVTKFLRRVVNDELPDVDIDSGELKTKVNRNYGGVYGAVAEALMKGHGWHRNLSATSKSLGVRRTATWWNSELMGHWLSRDNHDKKETAGQKFPPAVEENPPSPYQIPDGYTLNRAERVIDVGAVVDKQITSL